MNDTNDYAQWWLATLGRTVIWARLRVREAGTAEVFDSDGNTLSYDSEDTARAALMDAEFVELEGLDEDDARTRGFALSELTPPQAGDDAALAALMVQKLPLPH
ncbi:hypothetical protein [Lysobacter sp. CA199]|uniref:hypothetical protein n=1 Tax=Lysobacter sp. CA199 TaxID=3455608 RepID=UPI003F8D1D23